MVGRAISRDEALRLNCRICEQAEAERRPPETVSEEQDEREREVGRAVLRLPELAQRQWHDHRTDSYKYAEVGLRCLKDGGYMVTVDDGLWPIVRFGPYATPTEAIDAALRNQNW